jgi:hypothetical protein
MGGALNRPHGEVECRSEHTYAQQPLAVWWQGQRLAVETMENEWRTPRGPAFRLRCAGDLVFVVEYDEAEDRWQVAPQ